MARKKKKKEIQRMTKGMFAECMVLHGGFFKSRFH